MRQKTIGLRLYHVGNISSHQNMEVKQLGPQLTLGWVTIQGLDVDAVAKNTVKIPEAGKRGLHYTLMGSSVT